MRLLLAGMTLAAWGQVARANPYLDGADAPTPAAAAAAPAESSADFGALFESQPQPTVATPAAAPPAATGQPANVPGTSLGQPAAAQTPPPAAAAPTTPTGESAEQQRSALVQGPKPTKLMQQLMKAPAAAPLAGTPITLAEAVRDSRSRQEQTQRAKAYWDLAAAVADYYLAVHEAQELETYRAGVTAPSQQWALRQADLNTRIDAARLAAQSAQLQLHNLLGGEALASLPVPADTPHCGRYNAEYEEIFAARPDPMAKKLAEVLSLRHAELRSITQAVEDAEARLNRISMMRAPTDDGGELLAAQQLLSLQRRAFVARAREYNQEIAAYTELAAPADVATDRLVAMMIRTSTPANPLRWGEGTIEPVAAEEPADSATAHVDQKGVRPTFQAERVQEVRRPLQRLLGRDREQSIVVRRLRNLMDRE
jgi:hypothetical protein